MLMRIELGANPAEAIALQKKTTMKATGKPVIEDAVVTPNFTNSQLLGVGAFDETKGNSRERSRPESRYGRCAREGDRGREGRSGPHSACAH